jgi:ABC-type lipoprotein release transport system permease subunit
MNELFGVSMTYIAAVCVALTLLIFVAIGYIAWRNPVMFKMGLRNIPRRKAQTALIIVGLMLSTLIMSAAFGTGDTLTSSVTSEVFDILGEADQWVSWDAQQNPAPREQQVIPLSTVDEWKRQLAGDPDIEAIVPFQRETLPVQNVRTRLNEPSARIVAFRAEDAAALGGLRDLEGNPVQLSGRNLAVNEDLARELDARVGDTVRLFYRGAPVEFTVVAITKSDVLSGAIDPFAMRGGAVDFATLAELTGRGDVADAVIVSNVGGVREGLERSDVVTARLEAMLEGTPYRVVDLKRQLVDTAALVGSAFTAIFVVFGLFSIAAGILLIFLIFIMLAAERKPEIGMARAVGAKRRQVVESFLAEGMGYDLGSAVVGLLAGMGVTVAMVAIIQYFAGENFGLQLTVEFTLRSMVTAFSLGVIATFLVIFVASWRASRINITAAIRDLPETHPVDPEAASWRGYYRGAINGIAAFALPIGAAFFLFGTPGLLLGGPLVLVGLVSPWFYVLRNSDVAAPRARRTGEPTPRWPWLLGLFVPVIGWFLILPGYALALLLVRLTRDRRPAALPRWLAIGALLVWPLTFVVAMLQEWRARVQWSAAVSIAFGIAGIALTYGGLDRDSAFYFLLGVSTLFLWAAVTLRYFGIPERGAFTVTSTLLLALWYVPSSWIAPITGPLEGDIEMFFLSGVVMVTCGVFIVVYNADIILPAIARVGSRFGRLVPALKTAVAYPLTSRFRTGMTMAMIGLIMFSLVMMSTINSNFAALFLNDEARGGFDIVGAVNEHNPVGDLRATLADAGVDTAPIEAVGVARTAGAQEVEVENRDGFVNTEDGGVAPFSRIKVFGVDDEFIATQELRLKFRAAGYADDAAVWRALAEEPGLALLPADVTVAQQGFGGPGNLRLRLEPLDEGFQPFTLTLRDPGTGESHTVTIVGQLLESADVFFALGSPDFATGLVMRDDTFRDAFPAARGQMFFVKLAPGTDAVAYAKTVEAALVQASADSLGALLDEQRRQQTGFLLVFQGFMGLGLIVGIAALSVIASRAVVERRQQIGMLRAIGYKRSMVAMSFLFESGFIAVSGILLGLSLGLSLAWVLFTTGEFGEEARAVEFAVPWLQLGLICGIAFVASMLMTVLPARAASRVPVAEALRYE